MPGMFFSVTLITTPMGVPGLIGTPHLILIASCDLKVTQQNYNGQRKDQKCWKWNQARNGFFSVILNRCLFPSDLLTPPYKDLCPIKGRCGVYEDTVCFDGEVLVIFNKEMLRNKHGSFKDCGDMTHLSAVWRYIWFNGWAWLISEVP